MIHMTRYILLVDDDAIQAATRKAILERTGYSVSVSHTGSHALAQLEDPNVLGEVGLVITDHLMPGMKGPELVKGIHALLPLLPVLVLSGLPEAEEDYNSMDVVFRCKPFPPQSLIGLVRELLDQPIARTA
jgi:DNA-binding NtrC family response regulator